MGRGVEHYLLEEFLKEATELGYNTIVGEFIASKKNAPVAEMYPNLGLSPYNSGDSGLHLYKADISTLQIAKHFVTAGVSGSSTKN